MTTRLLRALLAAGAALLVLAGCSGAAPTAPTAPTAPAAAPDADTAFLQGMLPHHRQAVTMADLAPARAGSPEVRDLAARIRDAQAPEIDLMTRLLAARGASPDGTGQGGDHGGGTDHGGMSGMMGPERMRELEGATGPAFDRAFLTMMIEHHAGAVSMARTELDGGRDPEARRLAQAVVDTQQAEIEQMRALLGRV